MLNFKTILFPIDFSDKCRGAARYVEALASRYGSRLIVLHVLESVVGRPGELDFSGLTTHLDEENRRRRAYDAVEQFVATELKFLNAERRIEIGDPARIIVQMAQTENVDLIMMPTHGYGGFRRFILGSVTAKVLHDAHCPVWTGVHVEGVPEPDAISPRNIMCAIDMGDRGGPAIRAAAQLAGEHSASLTIAHAAPGSDALQERLFDRELREQLISEAKTYIEALCRDAGVVADICIDSGEVHKVIAQCAKVRHAKLLVIGRGQHSGAGRLRTHSHSIIRESPCPVISV